MTMLEAKFKWNINRIIAGCEDIDMAVIQKTLDMQPENLSES